MSSKYLCLPILKLFYINKYVYIAVEPFSNINFVIFEKNFHCSFDTNFENVQYLHILRLTFSEHADRLTVLIKKTKNE